MSTRGCVAKPLGDVGFEGVYQHFDSYPQGLGRALWHIYHEHFKDNVAAMQKALIDDHPGGWSSIDKPQFNDPTSPMSETLMMDALAGQLATNGQTVVMSATDNTTRVDFGTCYCHDRGENDSDGRLRWIKGNRAESKIDPLFIEYAYVLHKMGMDVYCCYDTGETEMQEGWGGRQFESHIYDETFAIFLPWDGPEPDWDQVHVACDEATRKANPEAYARWSGEGEGS